MPDYKSMYYHLAGRTATTVEVLEATVEMMRGSIDAAKSTVYAAKSTIESLERTIGSLDVNRTALSALAEKLKLAQQTTEEMFINSGEPNE